MSDRLSIEEIKEERSRTVRRRQREERINKPMPFWAVDKERYIATIDALTKERDEARAREQALRSRLKSEIGNFYWHDEGAADLVQTILDETAAPLDATEVQP